MRQPRCSRGHFLPCESAPYTREPDTWDETFRCTKRHLHASETTTYTVEPAPAVFEEPDR